MAVFALSFLLIVLSISGLAVGLFSGRRPLKKSCGAAGCEFCKSCPRRGKSK